MPLVTIHLYEGRTVEQKRELAAAITKSVSEIAKTSAEHVHIIFRDVAKHDWATAGKLASD
jgi:4-oxalocrotonate tautomerase